MHPNRTRTAVEHDPEAEGALKTGLLVNGLLAVVKLGGGLLASSPSLLADGYHSVGDVLTSGLGWLSYRWAKSPPDEDHHFGHGKYESVGAALVGGLLVATGAGVIWRALAQEGVGYEPSQVGLVVAASVVSILGNEFLAAIQGRAADRSGSATLAAMASDNRSDSLTSLLVVGGVAGAALGVSALEPVATGVIGVMVLWMGVGTLRDSLGVLTDRVEDPELRTRVEAKALGIPGVLGVQSVAAQPTGSFLRLEMEISVDGDWTVRKGHAIAHEVEEAVTRGEPLVVEVSVHVNPA